MSFERRLACSLLLLLAAAPIVVGLLPGRTGDLVAPFAILVATVATLLFVQERTVMAVSAAVGSMAMVVFAMHLGLAETMMLVSVVPASVLLVGAPVWAAAVTFILALATSAALAPETATAPFTLATPADLVGWGTVLAWTASMGLIAGKTRGLAGRVEQLENTAETIDQGIRRDSMELRAVTRIVADPSLAPLVRGQGLTHERLNMATRLFDDRILLALLRGDMTQTLTAAWILRSAALGGCTDPLELRKLIDVHGEEVIDADRVEWIAVFDPETGHYEHSDGLMDVCIESDRIRFERRVSRGVSRQTIETRMEVQALADPFLDHSFRAVLIGMVTTLGILLSMTATFGTAWGLATIAALCLGTFYLDHHMRSLRSNYAVTEAALEDRIDCRDDLHFGLARLHGTLLPYETFHPIATAVAHRLRGELLAGTFADVVLTTDSRMLVLAGEISGQGVASAFLSLTAQHALRAHFEGPNPSPDWETIENVVSGIIAREATALFFPVRIELGCLQLDNDGAFRGHGFLERVTVFDRCDRITQSVRSGQLSDDQHLYITPANARPGPEDRAPALDRFEASERICDMIEGEEWSPGEDPLGSLFSLVFDGVEAPAHGTIIEIAAREVGPTFLEGGADTMFTVVEDADPDDDDDAEGDAA